MTKRRALAPVALFMFGCAGHRVPEPAGVPPGTPHVSWIIMYGDSDTPDREFACQSTGPAECIVPASRAQDRVFSDVHVYYHGAGQETRYTGSMRIGFFNNAGNQPPLPVSVTVKREETISNISTENIVTDTPGTYEMLIDVTATQSPGDAVVPVREQVRVVVR